VKLETTHTLDIEPALSMRISIDPAVSGTWPYVLASPPTNIAAPRPMPFIPRSDGPIPNRNRGFGRCRHAQPRERLIANRAAPTNGPLSASKAFRMRDEVVNMGKRRWEAIPACQKTGSAKMVDYRGGRSSRRLEGEFI